MLSENYKERIQELAGIKTDKEILFLVGFPGSGKSSYIKALRTKRPDKDYVVVSFDSTLEKLGDELGLGYNDAYEKIDFHGKIMPAYVKAFEKAIKKGKSIIIDDTNMKRSDRADALERVPSDYKKIAVVFNVPEEELKRRLEKRAQETGKYIPPEAIEKMKNYYIPPSKEEGFDKIINL